MSIMDRLHRILEVILQKEATLANQLDKFAHLEEEMTQITEDFLKWFVKYCDEHRIPFWREKQLESYIALSQKILKEIFDTTADIKELIESRKLPLRNFDDESPEDLPEPVFPKDISEMKISERQYKLLS